MADKMTFQETKGAVGRPILCIVGQDLKADSELSVACKTFDVDVRFSENGDDLLKVINDNLQNVGFVVKDFESTVYANIRKATAKIFGPPAILYYAHKKEMLPALNRPLFCTSMLNVTVCFAGFRNKEKLNNFVDLVHHMGGSVRKDFASTRVTSVTHLVTNVTFGAKYQYARVLGKPVMSPEWILKCWGYNLDPAFSITDLPQSEYKVKPFVSCIIAFSGFTADEQRHMEELTLSNGGSPCLPEDAAATHVVFEEQLSSDIPDDNGTIFVVKAEWFWASIQMDVRADESMYQMKSILDNVTSCESTPISHLTPNSRARKRKRLKETLSQLAGNASPICTSGTKQRRSAELAGVSLSPSILEATLSPSAIPTEEGVENLNESGNLSTSIGGRTAFDLKMMSPRQQVCYELFQTEINYVGILHTIVKLIKEPIEDASQVGGPLLDPTEVKIIFGNLQPIYDVHQKLRDDLFTLISTWNEDTSVVGKVILKYSQDLLKAYPPFVNFFEKTKEMLLKCDAVKPRFHAFLKICQNKPECGRQTLVELLIRPVQRLPSISLLLNDILKRTNKNNPDIAALEEAIKCVKEITTHINEDKRRTEGQMAMFVIVNDIENCPADLLSAQRHFVAKADVIELSGDLTSKGENLTMFLFTDKLEICKRRKCAPATLMPVVAGAPIAGNALALRSPSVVSLHSFKVPQKNYKHIKLLPLSHIKRVVDVKETEDCHNVFALVCRSNNELKESLHKFAFASHDNDSAKGEEKLGFLRIICRYLAISACHKDAENFLTSVEPHRLNIISSDTTTNTLSKAVRFASKTSKRVGRAFSFSKTPRGLTRAVSSFISPRARALAESPIFQTPLATASKRFPCASAINLHEIESPSRSSPATPSLGIKIKSFTIGPSALSKRL